MCRYTLNPAVHMNCASCSPYAATQSVEQTPSSSPAWLYPHSLGHGGATAGSSWSHSLRIKFPQLSGLQGKGPHVAVSLKPAARPHAESAARADLKRPLHGVGDAWAASKHAFQVCPWLFLKETGYGSKMECPPSREEVGTAQHSKSPEKARGGGRGVCKLCRSVSSGAWGAWLLGLQTWDPSLSHKLTPRQRPQTHHCKNACQMQRTCVGVPGVLRPSTRTEGGAAGEQAHRVLLAPLLCRSLSGHVLSGWWDPALPSRQPLALGPLQTVLLHTHVGRLRGVLARTMLTGTPSQLTSPSAPQSSHPHMHSHGEPGFSQIPPYPGISRAHIGFFESDTWRVHR